MIPENWRDLVIEEARAWMWTPYVHRARVKGVGVDCGNLLFECYNPIFPLKPLPEQYAYDWALHRSEEIYLDFIKPYVVPVKAPIRGGFSLFKFGRCFGHAGIYTGEQYIHAWGGNTQGTVMESKPGFFRDKQGALRPVKHFDVQWAS